MGYRIDLTGNKYGTLTVLEYAERKNNATYWKCLCDCGNVRVVDHSTLKRSKVCHCNRSMHGHKRGRKVSPTYHTWQGMKARCRNPNHKNYHTYGGRGITYTPRWEKFENFLEDMGERPEGMTLDRIDNDKGYYKENCRWVNQQTQIENYSRVIPVTHNGKTQCITAWCRELGIPRQRVYNRLSKGKTHHQALGLAA